MKKAKKKNTQTNSDVDIKYSGEVTIQIVHGDKVVKTIRQHNSGTFRLFQYLAKCLVGVYEPLYAPKYLRLFHGDDANDLSNATLLTDAVVISSTSFDTTSENGKAQLTFTVPGNIFRVQNSTPNILALYSQNDVSTLDANDKYTLVLATTSVSGLGGAFDDDTNLIIVWEMTIGN